MIYIIGGAILLLLIAMFAIYVMARSLANKNKIIQQQKEDIEQNAALAEKEDAAKAEVKEDAEQKKKTYSTGDIVDRFNASVKQLHDN